MQLDALTILRLAAESGRDPRSVRAAIAGRSRGLVTASVYQAAERLGVELPTPTNANGTRPDQERVPRAESETDHEKDMSRTRDPQPESAR
jgi:hypothetical protein